MKRVSYCMPIVLHYSEQAAAYEHLVNNDEEGKGMKEKGRWETCGQTWREFIRG